MNKFCPRCSKDIDLTKFKKSSRTKDGFQTNCEDCAEKARLKQKERYANPEYHQKILEKLREKYQNDPIYKEKLNKRTAEGHKKRYAEDPEHRIQKLKSVKDQYYNNTEYRNQKLKSQLERYHDDPIYKEKVNKKRSKNLLKQYHDDPKVKVHINISSQIRQSLKSGKKGQSWELIVGYSVEELMIHLESLFEEGMTWENYGKWHIDHRIPKSWFNFETINDPEFIKCWDLKNLKPMWGNENIAKGNKFSD
jgi:hypothetical protein